MTYVTGYLIPVPDENREAYIAFCERAGPVFKKHGALRVIECWGVDTPDGEVTSFPMAVKAKPGESVLFSWMEWSSKDAADAGVAAAMQDPDLGDSENMPFDGMRMMWGGFDAIYEA